MVAVLALFAQTINFSDGGNVTTMYVTPAEAASLDIPVENIVAPPVPASTFHRGFTDKQNQPCRPDHKPGEHYSSEIISKQEWIHLFTVVGIPQDHHNVLSAIAHAESGSQAKCSGDDTPQYINKPTANGKTWGASFGPFQIRTIIEETGQGTCRDISRLDDVTESVKCAWEISGNGKSYSPWSVTHSNRGSPYKKWIDKSW